MVIDSHNDFKAHLLNRTFFMAPKKQNEIARLTKIDIVIPKAAYHILIVGLEMFVRRPNQAFTACPKEGMIVITLEFQDVPSIVIRFAQLYPSLAISTYRCSVGQLWFALKHTAIFTIKIHHIIQNQYIELYRPMEP